MATKLSLWCQAPQAQLGELVGVAGPDTVVLGYDNADGQFVASFDHFRYVGE